MSARATASAGLFARVAPKAISDSAFCGVRFQTVSGKPALSTCAAIGRPIRPRPIKATDCMLVAAAIMTPLRLRSINRPSRSNFFQSKRQVCFDAVLPIGRHSLLQTQPAHTSRAGAALTIRPSALGARLRPVHFMGGSVAPRGELGGGFGECDWMDRFASSGKARGYRCGSVRPSRLR